MIDPEKQAANRRAREEKKKEYLRAVHARYLGRFRLAASEAPPLIARQVHAVIEDVLARDRDHDRASAAIRCGKGCNHCCKGPVEIFPQEAALMLDAARAAGVALDLARLERQSRRGIEDWHEQPPLDRACVFLGEDGACRIYADRPNACRRLLVLSEPAACDRERHAPESVERWVSWEAELLGAAALEAYGAALMPAALLAALKAGA